jgi:hypothetical protein
MPETVEMSTTVLVSSGTPTAYYELQKLKSFCGDSGKNRQNGEEEVHPIKSKKPHF